MNPLEALFQALSSFLPASQEAQADPQGFAQQLRQPPRATPEFLQQLMGNMPLAGGMAKVFKPAATEALSYGDKLLAALKSYTNPMELARAKGRLQPALQIAEGEPSLTNLLVGQGFGGHGPLYEIAQSMKAPMQKHGYLDPASGVFLDDVLSQLLRDPGKLKTSVGLLEKKIPLDAVIEALGFTPKMFP